MTDLSQIVVDLDPELKDAFLEAAKAENRAPSAIVQEFIADYVHGHEPAPEYLEFLERKVAKARGSIKAGRGIPNAEVEARFAKRREAIRTRNG